MAAHSFASLRDEYSRLWNSMVVKPAIQPAAAKVAARLYGNIARYRAAAKRTGVPAAVIAAIHERESGARFDTYLGNGQPLDRKTTIVPAGRGPFPDWESGAIDALRLQGLDKITDWSPARAAFAFESFNGFGYRDYHAMHSPYLWAGSQHYGAGKYIADGKWSATTVDQQLGAMVVLAALIALDPSLYFGGPVPPPVPAEPPPALPKLPTAPVPGAGKAAGLWALVLTLIAAAAAGWHWIAGFLGF